MDSRDLRIGDAEREQTTASLREHYAQGRLTPEELDERLDATLAAKTFRDLDSITADLPGEWQNRRAPDLPAGLPRLHAPWHGPLHGAMQARRAGFLDRFGRLPIGRIMLAVAVVGLVLGGIGTAFRFLLLAWIVIGVVALVNRRAHRRDG
ncbi:DUF1707 domain-containing protein [Nonomuraea longicatena]|uniref:DUF1707 domain-containing protein n=1 Tax=Nonomuraea longicatena TaxID=83682 RepID=A0ABN1NP30_9ACTN